jgi:hypothetical protein
VTAPSAHGRGRKASAPVTIITGPLNYLGVNPKINCAAPKPSR